MPLDTQALSSSAPNTSAINWPISLSDGTIKISESTPINAPIRQPTMRNVSLCTVSPAVPSAAT
ncbi:hypothetical protein D3C80_1832280 [compost metagenome]